MLLFLSNTHFATFYITILEKMITSQISIFTLFCILCNVQSLFFDFFVTDYSAESMIKRAGYPLEIHNVTTEDGYILTVHRIPGDKGAQPVLLMHGLLCNSALWLVSGKEHSLAYVLADQGYDVWLGNSRGNTYGLNHINLTLNDAEFWDFSYHEMSLYDLPATINYIQTSTNEYPLYIGHSQGTTIGFLLGIFRPDVANSLKQIIHLAPVAYVAHFSNSFLRSMSPIVVVFIKIFQYTVNLQSFMVPSWKLPLLFIKCICAVLSVVNVNCLDILGYERPELFDQTILPAVLNNFPDGTSLKNILFYIQHLADTFDEYDYGQTKNIELYNSSTPPEYDLTKVTQPNTMFMADNDIFVKLPDLNKLIQLVPNIVNQYMVNASGFTHLDFLWGKTAKDVVYNQILELTNDL